MKAVSALLLMASALVGFECVAAPGDIDATFGNGGIATTDVTGGTAHATCVAVQSDGKIAVGGFSVTPSNQGFLVRYTSNGTIDPSLNGTGRVAVGFQMGIIGNSTLGDANIGIAIQADGKIVLGGGNQASATASQLLFGFRISVNGDSASSFFVNIGFGQDQATCVAVQADGKIVLAGASANPVNLNFSLARFTTTLGADNSFNGVGKVTTEFPGSSSASTNAIAIQPDGKIVAAGYAVRISSNTIEFAFARYNTDGTLDTSFGTNGIVQLPADPASFSEKAFSVTIQPDGKIVAVGDLKLPSGLRDWMLVRLLANGTLDTTFGGTGRIASNVGGGAGSDDTARKVLLQRDGKIVVAGFTGGGTAGNGMALRRFSANGSADGTFNQPPVNLNFATSDYLGAALQDDGKIVVTADGPGNNILVARYHGLPLVPEIAVEQAQGTNLADGSASVSFGNAITGANQVRVFTVRNFGATNLTGLGITIDGANASDFAVTSNPATPVAAGGSTTFTVRFLPTTAGAKAAALHISSNDSDESPFDITVTGRAFAPAADDDGDHVTNEAEVNLAALGFDPLADSSALGSLVGNNASGLGLYSATDIQTIALTTPVLEKNQATGTFRLSIGIEKSTNLVSWTPLLGYTPTFDPGTGRITIEFAPGGANAQFYQVFGAKP